MAKGSSVDLPGIGGQAGFDRKLECVRNKYEVRKRARTCASTNWSQAIEHSIKIERGRTTEYYRALSDMRCLLPCLGCGGCLELWWTPMSLMRQHDHLVGGRSVRTRYLPPSTSQPQVHVCPWKNKESDQMPFDMLLAECHIQFLRLSNPEQLLFHSGEASEFPIVRLLLLSRVQ